MEKQKIYVVYQGSGVKTIFGIGRFFLFLAIISIIVAIIGFVTYLYAVSENEFSSFISLATTLAFPAFKLSVALFIGAAICMGLSTFVKSALIKNSVLVQQYQFIDVLSARDQYEVLDTFNVGDLVSPVNYPITHLKIAKKLDSKLICTFEDETFAGAYDYSELTKIWTTKSD